MIVMCVSITLNLSKTGETGGIGSLQLRGRIGPMNILDQDHRAELNTIFRKKSNGRP